MQHKFQELCEESTFWHKAVKQSFSMHVDNFEEHGNWRDAFKALVTGRFYGWGQNWNTMFMSAENPQFHRFARNSPWPRPLEDKKYQGVVDVQSGSATFFLQKYQY
jgi:hypothetical protein